MFQGKIMESRLNKISTPSISLSCPPKFALYGDLLNGIMLVWISAFMMRCGPAAPRCSQADIKNQVVQSAIQEERISSFVFANALHSLEDDNEMQAIITYKNPLSEKHEIVRSTGYELAQRLPEIILWGTMTDGIGQMFSGMAQFTGNTETKEKFSRDKFSLHLESFFETPTVKRVVDRLEIAINNAESRITLIDIRPTSIDDATRRCDCLGELAWDETSIGVNVHYRAQFTEAGQVVITLTYVD